jgi:hypothetical protein
MEISFLPRWLIRYLSNDSLKQIDLNILISNVLIILTFIFFNNSVMFFMNLTPHFCLFDRLIGVECPVCGITRAFCEISKGNFTNAYNFNFASFSVAFYFVFQIPLRLFSLIKNDSHRKTNIISKYMGFIVLLTMIVNWFIKIYQINY